MKTVKFRPLRRLKSGKIAVSSYAVWRTVRPSVRQEIVLIVDTHYRSFEASELVHNHKGENLFFKDFDPYQIPIYDGRSVYSPDAPYAVRWDVWLGLSYNVRGMDCEGVPTFSHGTPNHIANGHNNIKSIDEYEPLTVGIVTKFWGWFLEQGEAKELVII